MSLEYGRKNVQPQQVRQIPTEAGPESETFDTVVQGLKSKLQTLEDKYSSLTSSVPRDDSAASQDQSLSLDSQEGDFPMKGTDVTGGAQELFRRLSDLISAAQTKVLSLCSARTRLTEAEVKGRVLEEFAQLSNGVWDLTFRHKLKTEAPTNFKEWMRKILKLEDEKRAIEVLHKETMDTETNQLKEQIQAYQNDLSIAKETNAFLEDQVQMLSNQLAINLTSSKTDSRKAISAHPVVKKLHQELNESIPKALAIARDLSLDSSVSSIEMKHSRKSSGSFIVDLKISPVGSVPNEKDRALSQFDRHIHSLKAELEKCKEALRKTVKERDVLKAWKESYQRNPPNLTMAIQQKELENEHERKKLTGKALILQHKLNAVLIGVQKFIRVSSNLLKSARDRDLVAQFENSRADIEVVIREVQREEGKNWLLNTGSTPSRGSPARNVSSVTPEKFDSEKVIRMLENENKRLEDELRMERERADTFAEALELTHKQVEALSGVAFNPVLYLQQQDQVIKQLQEQIRQVSFPQQIEESPLLEEAKRLHEQNEQLRKEGKIVQDQVQLLRSSNNRLMQDLVSAKNDLNAVSQVCQIGLKTLETMMDQRCQRILEDISQKDQSLSKLKSAVLDRFQEQLRSLIQINEMMSKSTPGEEVDMELVKKLLEEKTHLEFMLQQNQDWSSNKISELQEQLDQENQLIADLQAVAKVKDTQLQEFSQLLTQVKAAESSTLHQQELEKDLLKLRTELATEASFWKKKELEFQELLYEKNRLEGMNQELMENAKNRATDLLLAEESFQKATSEANRRIEEVEIERRRVQQEKDILEKEISSAQDQLEDAQQEIRQMRIVQVQLEKQVGERINTMSKQKEKLKAAKSESSDRVSKLNKELMEMADLLTESQILSASKAGEVERLNQIVAEVSLNSEDLLSRYQSEREKFAVELNRAQKEAEKAKEDGENVRTSLDSERVRVAGLTSELTATKTQVQDLHRKVEQLSRDLTERESENTVALAAIESLKSKLEVSFHERETNIQFVKISLMEELTQQKTRISALEEENLALENHLILMEDQVKALESDLKLKEKTLSEVSTQAKSESEAFLESKSSLQLANDHQGFEIQRLTGENRELRERLEKLMTDLKAQEKDKKLTGIITQLQRQLEEKTQEVMELKQLRQAKEIAMNQHFLAFDQVKREAEEGKRNREMMSIEMKKVMEEKQELALKCDNSLENAVKLQQELETLKKKQTLEAIHAQHLAEEQAKSLSGLQSQLNAKIEETELVKKSISELQNKALQKESELHRMQQDLTDTATRFQTEKQVLERRISTLESERKSALIEEKNDREAQNIKLKEMQSLLEEEIGKGKRLQELIVEKQGICDDLSERLESAISKVQRLEGKCEGLTTEIARIGKEKTDFEEEANRLRGLSQVTNGKLDTCMRENLTKDAQISRLGESLEKSERQLQDLQAQVQVAHTNFDQVKSSAVLKVAELKKENEKAQTEVTNLKIELERCQDKAKQLGEELAQQTTLTQTLQSDFNGLKIEHSHLLEVNHELQSNLELLKSSTTYQYQAEHKKRLSTENLLQESTQSLRKCEEQASSLSKKLQDQESLLASKQKDLATSRTETESLQFSLHSTELKLKEQDEKLAEVSKLLSEKRIEYDSLAEKIRTAAHTLTSFSQTIQGLEEAATESKARISSLEQECKAHSEARNKLSEALETKERTFESEKKELLAHIGKSQELMEGKETELLKCYHQIEEAVSELKTTKEALEVEKEISGKLELLKEDLGKEIRLLRSAFQDSNSKLALESGKLSSQEEANATLNRNIKLTEGRLQEVQVQFESLQREVQKTKKSAVLKEKELSDALQEAHLEALSLKDELSRTEDKVKSLKQEIAHKSKELSEQLSLVQKLQVDLTVEQKENLKGNEALQSKLEEERSAHVSVASQLSAEHEQRLSTEKSLQESTESLQKLEKQVQSLTKKLQDQDRLLTSQQKELVDSQIEKESLQSNLQSVELKLLQLSQVEQTNATQKLQIEALFAQIQSTMTTHHEELLQARTQITTLDHLLAVSKSDLQESTLLYTKAQDDLSKSQELHSFLQSDNQRLENENAGLKEEIRKLNSGDADEPLSTNPILDNISDILHLSEEAKQTEGGASLGSPERRRTTNSAQIESDPMIRVESYFSPQDSLLQDLGDLLSTYRNPQEDLLTTVRKLIEELELTKKNKSGVVIPRLQLRSNRDSKESQTSDRDSLSVSMQEEPKGSEELHEDTPPSDALDKSIGASEDQDTPRQKILPELWKKRVSNEIRQVKTDEIGYLKTKVKAMEKELSEESGLKLHLEMQNRLLKEEVAEKDRQLKRAAVAETGGEKSPVNVEHLKDVLMNLIMLLSKQYFPPRSANVESLINTVYSLLFLSPTEVKQIETARIKGKAGFFSKLLK